MKKKIVALCIVASFLCLQSVVQTFAGVSDIKKKMDQENTDKPSTSQSASEPAPANSATDSFDEVLKKAEAGDAKAQDSIGFKYDKGDGVAQDKKKAVEWYTKAAEQGHVKAQLFLGVMYETGSGVSKDNKKAVEWYTKAAEQGNVDAQYTLGTMYEEGEGVTQNKKKAVKWYTEAAEQGSLGAQFNLGTMYEEGEGVAQDNKKAVELYKKTAEQGYVKSQDDLVDLMNKKCANSAQVRLGFLYAKGGKGITMNKIEAYNWWAKAAKQGNESAQKNLDILCKESPWACK